MGKKTQYYIYSGICMLLGFIILASGMDKMPIAGDMYKCILERDCLLFRALPALIFVSFANHFVYLARMVNKNTAKLQKPRIVLGYAMFVVMFLVYAVFEIISTVNKPRGNGFLPEAAAVLLMLMTAAFFLRALIKLLAGNNEPEEPAVEPPAGAIEANPEKDRAALKMAMRLVFIVGGALYILLVSQVFGGVFWNGNFQLLKALLTLVFFAVVCAMPCSVIIAIVADHFLNEKIEKYYPQLYITISGRYNFAERINKKKEIKALYGRDHEILGYYNRVVHWGVAVFLAAVLSLPLFVVLFLLAGK